MQDEVVTSFYLVYYKLGYICAIVVCLEVRCTVTHMTLSDVRFSPWNRIQMREREKKEEMVIWPKEMSTKESFVFLDAGQSGMCTK